GERGVGGRKRDPEVDAEEVGDPDGRLDGEPGPAGIANGEGGGEDREREKERVSDMLSRRPELWTFWLRPRRTLGGMFCPATIAGLRSFTPPALAARL